MSALLAGTGRCDITPAPGTPQGGWGAQTHQRGPAADMPLFATALVLSDSREVVAIVDADSIGFDREWTAKIVGAIAELTAIPRERIRFSCTHTHSGPNTFRLATISEGVDMVRSYLSELPNRIASAVGQAQKSLRPVRCAAGIGTCDINVNRRFRSPDGQVIVGRNWNGPVDRTVRVVRLDDLAENPVAIVVHYACHPTIMAWENQLFTPDYPGPTRQTVERLVGGACLFLQGACGNLTPRRGFTGDPKVYRRLGTLLGLEAAKVAAGIETLPRRERFCGVLQSGAGIALYEDEPVEPEAPLLGVCSRSIKMPAKKFAPPEETEAEADRLQRELNRLRQDGSEAEVRAATARATQAGWRAANSRLYHGKETIDWQMQGIRIGPVALLSVEGEPFIEIGQQIAQASPFTHTLFSGYSNGGFGYIPVRSAYAEGGYEVEASPFSPDGADVMVAEGLRLLRDLAGTAQG